MSTQKSLKGSALEDSLDTSLMLSVELSEAAKVAVLTRNATLPLWNAPEDSTFVELLRSQPISRIVWEDPNVLTANHWNPNHVLTKEMRLLEFSIRRQGFIQPILISSDKIIIDGFHRHTIAKRNGWLVPCAVLEITPIERKLLTVRINRAKGVHIAVRMADLIKELIADGATREQIAQEIGGDVAEVELLMKEDVFEKFNLEGHEYSKAWIPKAKKGKAKKSA